MKKLVTFIVKNIKKIRIKLYCLPFQKCGKNVSIKFPIKIEGKKNLQIDDDSEIGEFSHIWAQGGVQIGKRVLIANSVIITSLGHDPNMEDMRKGIISKPITIQDDVWIGANSCILPGVTLGRGSIVGAGSVVTKNVDDYAIVVGNPAKFIRKRSIKYVKK